MTIFVNLMKIREAMGARRLPPLVSRMARLLRRRNALARGQAQAGQPGAGGRHRRPGVQALSSAERQARYRARKAEQAGTTIRYRRAADRRARPQRWHDAVEDLLALQAEYTAWADALPDALRDTPTAEALHATVDLDLSDLAGIKPPRGYGRD